MIALFVLALQAASPSAPLVDVTLLGPSQVGPVSSPYAPTVANAQRQGLIALAAGSIDSDDFNRPTLGSGWTQMGSGSMAISADTLTSGSGNDWMQRVGTTAAYEDATAEFDLLPNTAGMTSYVAMVTGIGSDQLYTKLQGSSTYTNIGFYHGFNGGGFGGYGGFVSITPVTGGHIRMYISNAGDTMNVDIDENFDGVYEYHYESSGIIAAFSGTLGTGVGIGGYNFMSMDNWALGDGPNGPTLVVTGACPGLSTFAITGADPFGPVGIVYGPAGSLTLPSGPCAGMSLDIAAPTIAGIFGADVTGGLTFSATLPAGACGATVQAVDLNNCAPSNAEVL